jgi:hypothetical protein
MASAAVARWPLISAVRSIRKARGGLRLRSGAVMHSLLSINSVSASVMHLV